MIKQLLKKCKIVIYVYRITVGRYKEHRLNKAFLTNGEEILIKIDSVFKKLDIEYWLEFGTLLGAVRENGFIGHDVDVDVGLFLNSYSDEIQLAFEKEGFVKTKRIEIEEGRYGLEESYEYKGVNIDLFYFSKVVDGENIYCHEFFPIEGKVWADTLDELGGLIVAEDAFPYTGLSTIHFLNREFPIPEDPELHLSVHYGSDYMQSNPSWDPRHMAKNLKFMHDKLGMVQFYEH